MTALIVYRQRREKREERRERESSKFTNKIPVCRDPPLGMDPSADHNILFSRGLKPILLMMVAQLITVASNIFYKLAIIHSMPTSILVAYRFIFGTISLAPLAFYNTSRTKPTWKQVCLTFVYGLLGSSLYFNLCLKSLTYASATFVTAIINITPVITFVFGLAVRLERLECGKSAGKIKVVGLMLSISGVMLLAFCKRIEIDISPIKFSILPQDYHKTTHPNNQILGLALAMIATFSSASFLTIQAKFEEDCHNNIFFIPFMMNMMAAIQAVIYALCIEKDWEQWKLGWNIRFWTASFVGVFGSGLTTTMTTWCISKMGPLFVSTFNPIGLILMAMVGSSVLEEKLYVTSLVGIVFIIMATLLVLYGKLKEVDDNTITNNQIENHSRHQANEADKVVELNILVDSGHQDNETNKVIDSGVLVDSGY